MTLRDLKDRMLRAHAIADAQRGAENAIDGFREAIEALPDRARLYRLPAEVRHFVERELAKIGDP